MDLISSRVLLGAAGAAGGGVSYWFSKVNVPSSVFIIGDITCDSQNNVYVLGLVGDSTPIVLIKLDLEGNILWQRSTTVTTFSTARGVSVDSSDNVYVSGNSRTNNVGIVLKYNSSGVLQWQRQIGAGSLVRFLDNAVGSSGDVYSVGFQQAQGAGSNDAFVVKYNSSGTLQWQRALGGSGSENSSAVALDSADNVYHVGNSSSTGGITLSNGYIEKLDSSGTSQWRKYIARPSSGSLLLGVAVNQSDGSIYVHSRIESTYFGSTDIGVIKLSSAGNLQWQRIVGTNQADRNADGGNKIALDSLGNVYTAFYYELAAGGNRELGLVKYNSSGVLQWQRKIAASGINIADTGIFIDGNDDIILHGQQFVAKLPNDGSLTGVYGIYTYAVSSFSETAGSETVANPTNLSSTVTTLTSSASSFADGAGTTTVTVTTI